MAKNLPYYRRRIEKLWEEIHANSFKVTNLKKNKVKLEPVTYIKRRRIIEVGDFEVKYASINTFTKVFKNFPENAIANCKVICKFHTNSAYVLPGFGSTFVQSFFYTWKQINTDDRIYNLIMTVNDTSFSGGAKPLFCQIFVIFYNRRHVNEIQHKKA